MSEELFTAKSTFVRRNDDEDFEPEMQVTSFHGGRDNGSCLQFTLRDRYISLTDHDVMSLTRALATWVNRRSNEKVAIGFTVQSVLQDWVMRLPLREQGTLLTCIRGCDLTPKLPLDSVERRLVSAFRYAVMNPADPREVDVPGAFFSSEVPRDFRASAIGHYPQHWVAHIMHGAQVIAYRHPNEATALEWEAIYLCLVEGMHLRAEMPEDMAERLSEDRIASGKVVS